MAGDWIKIENVTPNKPEVWQMAEFLKIDPDAVVGKMVRIWVWADEQTYDGYAGSVTSALLDRITGLKGFTEAMLDCGWLLITSKGLVFPNFDRHNGQTGKQRGLTAKRMQKLRGKNSDDGGVTLASPEKRREEKRKEREGQKFNKLSLLFQETIKPNHTIKTTEQQIKRAKARGVSEANIKKAIGGADQYMSIWEILDPLVKQHTNGKKKNDPLVKCSGCGKSFPAHEMISGDKCNPCYKKYLHSTK